MTTFQFTGTAMKNSSSVIDTVSGSDAPGSLPLKPLPLVIQGKFGSQWLNVVPCKYLGLKLDDQQLRISIGLRLGANICVAHTCHCGKRVERDGFHGLSCTKSAGRFSRHATLNSLIKQNIAISRLAFSARTAWTVSGFSIP